MRKFLIVGCGGSGGATIRFMMDQLKADLRGHGIHELPHAWQFVQIDVPTVPESPEGLGTVRDLGGRYLSVSSPGNTYGLVANNVEQSLMARSGLRGLAGWTPAPKESAAYVPVTNGAGQFRAVGRMLTLTDLGDIRTEINRAWEQLQRPDAWDSIRLKLPHLDYDPNANVVPIVVGSMAGGSGASMFLDVCRLLGRVQGLNRAELGVFLFTADVFSSLPENQRTGIDGNALGSLGEIIAAQTRSADGPDAELFAALGIPPEPSDEPPFARVFPIGSSIGGDGAKFGDGTQSGVYRGLGRALAATMISEKATDQYIKSKIENPTPPTLNRSLLGWGVDSAIFTWGSFGYASLSLGRDRYAEYASQRMARSAADRLTGGHLNPMSQLPGTEQLNILVESQWSTFLDRMRFPLSGANSRAWFTNIAFAEGLRNAEAQRAIQESMDMVTSVGQGQAAAWVDTIRVRLPQFQNGAADKIREAAYLWANGWALQLEQDMKEEFLRAMTQKGIAYARALVFRLRAHLTPVLDELRQASAQGMGQPLMIDPEVHSNALALKRTVVGAGHALGELIAKGFNTSAQKALNREAARVGAEVLSSFANDVLGGLERAAGNALVDLERARSAVVVEAGLAQLATNAYGEWPEDTDFVPTRFDHADNEILLTTSREFPAQFKADVVSSVPAAGGVYDSAREAMVGETICGRWQSTGGQNGPDNVLVQRVAWRPAALPRQPISNTPTPASQPVYDLAVGPRALLDRTRAHLDRLDQPFHRFSGQSIESYLSDPAMPDSVLAARVDEFVAKFQEAMRLARPLVGVSRSMIQVMHPGMSLQYEYSFSDIPVSPSAVNVVARISAVLDADPTLDETTVTRFEGALKDNSKENRIAMFGSYPKYSPLVFNSLLEQIQNRWTSAPEQALSDLWMWKRTRPLPASLAMGPDEQRAMVAGWFLGRLLGVVAVPATAQSTDHVQVWDFVSSGWLGFPARLLTPPARFRGRDDWLPAVLESHSLAIVQCNNDVQLHALKPYRALRAIYDNSAEQPHGSYGAVSGVGHLARWLDSGVWPSDSASEVLNASDVGPQVSAAARADAARAWLEAVAQYIGAQYLSEGGGVGALSERKARIETVAQLSKAPMFTEISELAYSVLHELIGIVNEALAETGQHEGVEDVFRPVL